MNALARELKVLQSLGSRRRSAPGSACASPAGMVTAACKGPAAYCPRRAPELPLYRLAETHHETFKQAYDERLAGRYGHWRAEVERTLWAFLDWCEGGRGRARS